MKWRVAPRLRILERHRLHDLGGVIIRVNSGSGDAISHFNTPDAIVGAVAREICFEHAHRAGRGVPADDRQCDQPGRVLPLTPQA